MKRFPVGGHTEKLADVSRPRSQTTVTALFPSMMRLFDLRGQVEERAEYDAKRALRGLRPGVRPGRRALDDRVFRVVSGERGGVEIVVRFLAMLEEVQHLLAGHAALGFSSAGDRRVIAGHDGPFRHWAERMTGGLYRKPIHAGIRDGV